MRSLPGVAIASAFVALAMASACTNAKAQAVLPDATPLTIPHAPPRVVVPPAPEPRAIVAEPAPPAASPTTANPPAGGGRSNRDTRPVSAPPANPPAATPPPAPTTPATPLETQANQSELEQRARGLLATAKATLEKINYQALSGDGKAQYDTAQRFMSQADSALRAKNVVYAWQLADKANTIATLLTRSTTTS